MEISYWQANLKSEGTVATAVVPPAIAVTLTVPIWLATLKVDLFPPEAVEVISVWAIVPVVIVLVKQSPAVEALKAKIKPTVLSPVVK